MRERQGDDVSERDDEGRDESVAIRAAFLADPLRGKDRSMAEYSDTRSECPNCGEWRDSPTADCAGCGLGSDAEGMVCAFCGGRWPCTPDEHKARILAAEELDPGAEWNLAGVDR